MHFITGKLADFRKLPAKRSLRKKFTLDKRIELTYNSIHKRNAFYNRRDYYMRQFFCCHFGQQIYFYSRTVSVHIQ